MSHLSSDFQPFSIYCCNSSNRGNKSGIVGAFSMTRVANLKIKALVQKITFILYNTSQQITWLPFKSIPENNNPYISRSALNNKIPFFNVKANFLKMSLFPALITKFICSSSLCRIFKNLILKFIRSQPNRIPSTQNFEGLKLSQE